MKKFLLVLTALTGLLVSCSDGGSPSTNPIEPPGQKALVVFDNTYGLCTAIVYDDYRRRSEDKVAEVPAGRCSQEFERMPSVSEPFYFAYLISLNGIGDFTLNYVPKNGKDQKAVRLDANAKTTVLVPKLDETFSSADQLLSPRSSLLLQNVSTYSFELHRGRSSILPDNISGSPVVNSWGKAFYTINTSDSFDPGAGTVSNYRLLVGADYKEFPDSPDRFEPGHFYSYIYNGDISLDSDIPMKIENIIVKSYTIDFNANDATGTAPAAQTAKAGSVITLPGGNGLSKAGYTFGGWNVNASGTEINYSAGADYLATGDITLYAKWFPLGTVTYTVNFNSNGGNAIASQNMASGMAAFRPINPVMTGYTFIGWYSDSSLSVLYDFTKPVTGSITLYAKWDTTRYTVTFNANGASGQAPAPQTVNTGIGITLPNGAGLSKTGYTFGGWSIDDSGAEITYNAGAFYTVTGDTTLFAKWDTLPGTGVPSEIVIPPGGTIIHINTQAGLESIRSHINDPAYNYGKNAYVLDNDLTLSGTWMPIGYVETVDSNGNYPTGIHAFSGNFYGNGHTIRGLILPGGSIHYIGLFGYMDGALIDGLQVELGETTIAITNTSSQRIGVIVGAQKNSIIRNCGVYSQSGITVSNAQSYGMSIGGICGTAMEDSSSALIENCYVSMNITLTFSGTHGNVGGVAFSTNTIRNCYYVGTITANGLYSELHGVVAYGDEFTTQNSYSAGKIINNATGSGWTSSSGIGRHGTISNCATLMERIDHASGSYYARIQRDHHSSFVSISNNYAYSGMLLKGSTVTSNDPNSKNGLDKTATELKQRSTYETGLGWDFDNVWEMGPPSYPFPILKWQNGVVKLPQGFSVIGG
jgi:uncharacterized repeat protein (TIGR02543 family)